MTTAADILRASGVLVPADLLEVDPAAVRVQRAPWWLRVVLRPAFAAIAGPATIFVRQWPAPGEAAARLVLHELVHVEQWRRHGSVEFLLRYLGDYLKNLSRGIGRRDAYLAIDLERDARVRAESVLAGLRRS